MARWAKCWRQLAAATLVSMVGLAGCGQTSVDPQGSNPSDTGTVKKAANSATPQSSVTDPSGTTSLPPPPNDEWHQPFAKAAHSAEDPPANVSQPPDQTISGKAVGKLYTEVLRIWDTIRFADSQGKRIGYTATIDSELGTIEIELRPDIAPNHVRNFIALARVGYYDGLCFDRIRNEKAEDGSNRELDTVEAGCPLGTGEPGGGSIGYWLLPEIAKPEAKITHEPGTVGACHGPELDTAACRFYITLDAAPALDGNYTIFGKVTRGLDIARGIWKQPHVEEDSDGDGSHRPVKPVVINKVTIHEHPAGGSTARLSGLQYIGAVSSGAR